MVLKPRNSSNRCQLLRYDDLVLLELAADRRDSVPVFRWTADGWVHLLPIDPWTPPRDRQTNVYQIWRHILSYLRHQCTL